MLRPALVGTLLLACSSPGAAPPVAPPAEAPVVVAPAAAPEVVRTGAEVFAAHCSVCHGEAAKGDGPGAVGLVPPPTDLTGPRPEHLRGIPRRHIIEEGRPGTAMVGWKTILTPADLEAVYGFVHDLHAGRRGHH